MAPGIGIETNVLTGESLKGIYAVFKFLLHNPAFIQQLYTIFISICFSFTV